MHPSPLEASDAERLAEHDDAILAALVDDRLPGQAELRARWPAKPRWPGRIRSTSARRSPESGSQSSSTECGSCCPMPPATRTPRPAAPSSPSSVDARVRRPPTSACVTAFCAPETGPLSAPSPPSRSSGYPTLPPPRPGPATSRKVRGLPGNPRRRPLRICRRARRSRRSLDRRRLRHAEPGDGGPRGERRPHPAPRRPRRDGRSGPADPHPRPARRRELGAALRRGPEGGGRRDAGRGVRRRSALRAEPDRLHRTAHRRRRVQRGHEPRPEHPLPRDPRLPRRAGSAGQRPGVPLRDRARRAAAGVPPRDRGDRAADAGAGPRRLGGDGRGRDDGAQRLLLGRPASRATSASWRRSC